MRNARPVAFVLVNTNHGSMLVNRFDYRVVNEGGYGVGYQLLNTSSFDPVEVDTAVQLLNTRRKNFGDGVVAIDCGANVGVHTIEWAQAMHGWGEVIAFEAQERIYYALAGNITLNNCFNAKAILAAVGANKGEMLIPQPNYFLPSSFGSLELKKSNENEYIGQNIDYSDNACVNINVCAIDDLNLGRLDFMKIDIEGMEIEALNGAFNTISKFRPQLIIEKIKSNESAIDKLLRGLDYEIFPMGLNILAIHKDDPVVNQINIG